jgi:thioredoxin reductase (NADPH)
MRRAVILAVDDDAAVLAAVTRDLLRRYGERWRVLRASSGAAALRTLRRLKLADERVALLLVDQRMPGMSGVAFLRQALQLFPDAKRVLLTAYADTDAAIAAINQVALDHYLLKPWDPPDEKLFPVLDDLLDAWRAGAAPPDAGLRVVASRWSAEGHRIRDFLARNLVPYRWLDGDGDPEATALLAAAGVEARSLPLVVLPDGRTLLAPTDAELGEATGQRARAATSFYDVVIVGAEPAGLAGAVYAASEGRRTLVIERHAPGGQAGLSSRIENYLGFPAGLSGGDLARRAVAQARRFGAELLTPVEAVALRLDGGYPVVTLSNGDEVAGRTLLITAGVRYTRIGMANAERLTGAGIYYGGALTEALSTAGQDLYVLGGGNSAAQAALHLARYARSVTLLVRRTLQQAMSRYLIERVEAAANVHVRDGCELIAVHGEARLEALTLRDAASGIAQRVETSSLFVFIGATAQTGWLDGIVQRDARGFIYTGPDVMRGGRRPPGWTPARDPYLLETNVPGVFVAGDVRHRIIKGIASAVGEGSMAAQFIHQHLNSASQRREPRPLAAVV